MVCNRCGKVFFVGNRPDGMPNGYGFLTTTGLMINVCADCIVAFGEMTEDERDKALKDIERKAAAANGNQ